jgi:tRNA (guanine37-N1)-methyltransferase
VQSNFNRDDFSKKISVPIINLNDDKIDKSKVIKLLKPFLLKVQRFPSIRDGKIYLNPDIVTEFSKLPMDELRNEGLTENLCSHEETTLTYDNWRADELVKAIIPENIDPASSYSKIGHIIHINLKDELLPFKTAIAQIYLDKTPGCRTVINKAQSIDNTFRNFQIDLLLGDEDYQAQVKENGVTFEFDFASVYWNSRLSTEHERLVKLLNPNDYLYDVFAGVGPFSVPAGKKRVNVLANDLNPHSFKWLEHNVKKNKVDKFVKTFNLDGREFILKQVRDNLLERMTMRQSDPVEYNIHIAMNLPALAVTFLDSFVGLLKNNELGFKDSTAIPTPICHCYCFVKGVRDSKEMARELVEENLGFALNNKSLKNIAFVRNVAPNKDMMRVDLLLTSEILFGDISTNKRSNDCNDVNVPCKKSCNELK